VFFEVKHNKSRSIANTPKTLFVLYQLFNRAIDGYEDKLLGYEGGLKRKATAAPR